MGPVADPEGGPGAMTPKPLVIFWCAVYCINLTRSINVTGIATIVWKSCATTYMWLNQLCMFCSVIVLYVWIPSCTSWHNDAGVFTAQSVLVFKHWSCEWNLMLSCCRHDWDHLPGGQPGHWDECHSCRLQQLVNLAYLPLPAHPAVVP